MTNEEIAVKTAIDGWHAQLNATDKVFDSLSDEELMHEVSPGRNRGIYLLGHLTGVHDHMLQLLRFEDSLYPALVPVFLEAPDKTVEHLPAAAELRQQWKTVNDKLAQHFKSLPAGEWFARHASISEEDFVKEPHRNRFAVLQSRTNHLSYHRGQLVLLQKKG
jgi:hypothetical protein